MQACCRKEQLLFDLEKGQLGAVEVRAEYLLLHLSDRWSVMDRRRQVHRRTEQLKVAADYPSGIFCVGKTDSAL